MIAMLFISQGRLRPIWRALAFFGTGAWIISPLLWTIWDWFAALVHMEPGLTAAQLGFYDSQFFFMALPATALFAYYEGRRIDGYGMPIRRALGRNMWEGLALGVVMPGAIAAGMFLLGGMRIHGLASSGPAAVESALAWLGATVVVGVSEEFWFRSYFLQTLWRSLGFWPGAIVVALIFASDHYFFKSGENIWDVITLVSTSLVLSYSVLRSGTLWFAVRVVAVSRPARPGLAA